MKLPWPSTLNGWLLFYMNWNLTILIGAWAFTGKIPPNELLAVVGAFFTAAFAVMRGESPQQRSADEPPKE